MGTLIENFLNPDVIRESLPYLFPGLLLTLLLCVTVIPLGLGGGLALATMGLSRRRWLKALLILWVDLFRAFPPLVLLIFMYYGLPYVGMDIPPLGAVALAFLLNTSSYYGEIFRAGIESVPEGQWEAARSTGLGQGQALVWVVLPQAIRTVLPGLIGNTLEVVKLTSLASVVAFPELLRMARIAQGRTFNATPLVLVALIYFFLLWPVVRLLSRMERRITHVAG